MNRVLIVDDERQMQSLISFCLRSDDLVLTTASSGQEAMELLLEKSFDLLLLDLMMPGVDGFEVLRLLKEKEWDIPTIILSALGETDQIVEGLNLGAYDYMTKPFEPKELVARVQAVLRRTKSVSERKTKTLYGVTLDETQHSFTYKGEIISLTRKEYRLFLYLFSNPGRVYTREQLMYLIWDDAQERDYRNVDTHIKNIRTKLKQAGVEKTVVETVWGIGYRLPREEGLSR